MSKSKKINVVKLLKRNKDLKQGIEILKNTVPVVELDMLFEEIYRINFYRPALNGNTFPKSMEKLNKRSMIYPAEQVEREIFWMSKIFSKYHEQINHFLDKKAEFQTALLFSDLEKANDILKKIEADFGTSLWSLENKIALLQSIQGLEKQKEYTKTIAENERISPVYRLLIRLLSVKAEINVSPKKYNQEIEDFVEELDSISKTDDYFQYLKFKVNLISLDNYDYSSIIQIENDLSLIDRYMTFVEILSNLKVTGKLDFSEEMITRMKKNTSMINDLELDNLWNIISNEGRNFKSEEHIEVLNILDLYTEGNYKETKERAEKILKNKPFIVELYEVYVKSLLQQNIETIAFKGTLLNVILEDLKQIYINDELAEENLSNLIKICYVYSKDVWTVKLRSLTLNSYYDLRNYKENGHALRGIAISLISKPQLFNLLHPREEEALKTLDNYSVLKKESITLALQSAFISSNTEKIKELKIPDGRLKKYLAEVYYKQNDFDNALKYFSYLLEADLPFNKLEVIVGTINSYIKLNRYEEALELIVNYYFVNKNIINKIDLSYVMSVIEFNNSFSGNICTPILYDLYTRYISKDREGNRNDAYEDFLESYGVSKASELDTQLFKKKKDKLIYFFRYICDLNTMANSIEFESIAEVETERLMICQILSELDIENVDSYSNEIKSITQKQMVRKGIREIENSKIYVDVEGIKIALEKNLKENFARFKSFGFNKLNNIEPDYIIIDEELTIMLPSNEKWNLFSSMVIELRNNFVSSKEYGLDGYLSVGIRHGTLSGQLRGKIESEKLITQINSSKQKYHENIYWVERLFINDEKSADYLINCLSNFSESIDSLINKLKDELIQINIDNSKNEKGLFNYLITTKDLEYLYSLMNAETTYTEFVDIIIEYLWHRTEINLNNINDYLKNIFKEELNRACEVLLSDINALKDEFNIVDLKNTIVNVKTTLQYEVDKISSWFSRTETSDRSNYNISLPIDIGLEVAKNIYKKDRDYEIVTKNIEEITLKGKTFKSLVDVSLIIFENIFKRSGVTENQKIEINCFKKENKIIFNCINKVSDDLDIDDLNLKMLEKKQTFKDGNALEMVNKEGGSGFYKIFKIISVDLRCKVDMDFLYLDDKRFSITLEIDAQELIV
ncbi:hypothetical protein QWY14_14470 [Planococcus sp. N028]|uniref:Uncharacterized protein n=1 Tax=Planococcus shixiaomingii TaxID=3058393 RepID=A0ABT8N555_9BACL|nr:hypothetical protein [Planococcus sp. N028]MDN7243017.1 hypothetical protein [Planococcus sp. N028]